MDIHALPGGELVEAGLRDLEHGVASIAALLVSIRAPRFARLGLTLPPTFDSPSTGCARRCAARTPTRHTLVTTR